MGVPPATAAVLAEVIAAHRYRVVTEYDLQAAVGAVLADAGYQVSPEHVLSAGDRVDFLVEGVAVEVKIGGNAASVLRQLIRYGTHNQVTEILLVTTCRRHRGSGMVSTSRKPVVVLLVATA